MREFQQISSLWAQARKSNTSCALATVVKTSGSSYRLPGARLLVTESGQRAGSISGGCLEDDVAKKAWWLTEGNQRVVRKYDTTSDGEIVPEFGLGCSGIIHVLLERVNPDAAFVLDTLELVRKSRQSACIAHVLQPSPLAGQRLTLHADGQSRTECDDPELAEALTAECQAALEAQASKLVLLKAGIEVYIEFLKPPERLLVFGAGNDAVPVTELASYLGWEVFVFDGRPQYARPDRFPQANEVSVCQPLNPSIAGRIDPWTVAVLMTHSYGQDLDFLRELSTYSLPYLGILGPRKRTIQLLEDAGLDPSRLAPAIHSPMGLDIGADGPEQVALSVIAEIQAALNGRNGGLLRNRDGSIHSGETDSVADSWIRSIACA